MRTQPAPPERASAVSAAWLFLALAATAHARALPQEPAPESRAPVAPASTPALDRLRAYLDRNPFHGRSLDDLAAAVGLAALTAEYEARAAAEPAARAPRIVLARLAARAHDLPRANALLGALALESASAPREALELGRLSAALELDAGAARAAVAALTDLAARARPVDVDLCEALLEELAEAAEVAGDPTALERALAALGEVLGEDPAGLVALGRRCAEHGLSAAAEDALRRAVQASGDDAPRRCGALAALGALLEERGDGAAALAAYDEALALLAAGHWLRDDLLERALALRIGAGSLDAWFAERRAAPGADLDAIELDEVRALERAGRGDAALERLIALAARRPGDRALADEVLQRARAAGRFDLALPHLEARARAAEASGPLAAARAELELAEGLAATGATAGAQRALDRAERAATGPEDLGLLLRIAHQRAVLGARAGARATLERAAELAPSDVQPLLELALHAAHDGDEAARVAALERAGERAQGEDRVAVAEAWQRAGREDRARATLTAALADPAARGSAQAALVEALARAAEAARAAADHDGAAAHLTRARSVAAEWASESRGAARARALDGLFATLANREERSALAGALAAEGDAGGGPFAGLRERLGPVALALAEARLAAAFERHADAAAALGRALAAAPDELPLRREYARALAKAGDTEAALATLAELLRRAPEQRAELLLERARLEVERRQIEAARATLAEVAALARRSPETLREVAGRLRTLGDLAGAASVLQRCVRLDPTDQRAARTLAQLERELGRNADAARRLAQVWASSADEGERSSVLRDLEQTLGLGAAREDFLDGLLERAQRNAYDRAALDLALALLPRARRFGDVEALANLVLERAPSDLRGLAARSIARVAGGARSGASADIEARLARGEDPIAVFLGLCEAIRAGDDEDLTAGLGATAARHLDDEQVVRIADELDRAGYERLTVAFLRGAAPTEGPLGAACLARLDALEQHLSPPAFALRVLTALEDRDGATVVRAHRIGKLHHALGDREGCLARGRQLLELGAPRRMVEGFYASSNLGAEWVTDSADR